MPVSFALPSCCYSLHISPCAHHAGPSKFLSEAWSPIHFGLFVAGEIDGGSRHELVGTVVEMGGHTGFWKGRHLGLNLCLGSGSTQGGREVCVPQHIQTYVRRSQQTPQKFHPRRAQIGTGQNQNQQFDLAPGRGSFKSSGLPVDGDALEAGCEISGLIGCLRGNILASTLGFPCIDLLATLISEHFRRYWTLS